MDPRNVKGIIKFNDKKGIAKRKRKEKKSDDARGSLNSKNCSNRIFNESLIPITNRRTPPLPSPSQKQVDWQSK